MFKSQRTPTRPRGSRKGFSLIEVNVAILLVAVGLMALFALFPEGLRLSGEARNDTRQAAFAELALSMIEANAYSITNTADWVVANLIDEGLTGLEASDAKGRYFDLNVMSSQANRPTNAQIIGDRSGFILYRLIITGADPDPAFPSQFRTYDVQLYCTQNFDGDPETVLNSVPGFYTKLYFMGH